MAGPPEICLLRACCWHRIINVNDTLSDEQIRLGAQKKQICHVDNESMLSEMHHFSSHQSN